MKPETNQSATNAPEPRFGIDALVLHQHYGYGRVVGYDGDSYVILFKSGELRNVAFVYEGLTAEGPAGDGALDRVKQAVREVLGEYAWLDPDRELSKRWRGGKLVLVPGKEDTQPKEVPIEQFFTKLIGVREKLRVLEQKINNHPSLGEEEKLELEGYITRCYGSLTTFNSLFAEKGFHFRGTGKG